MKKKISFLLIGYSHIARKRVIDVFLKDKVTFSVASKSYLKKIQGAKKQFSNYDEALLNSEANIVYISLPNSLHFYWAKKALLLGYHVIVDKPLCYSIAETTELINIAKKKNKLLSEAIFYNYHAQIKKLLRIIKNKKKINKIKVNFVIPMPAKKSILLSKKLKGGAIMDMGPYAASINRVFFGEKITDEQITVKKNLQNLPISFKLKIEYSKRKFEGLFKFGGNYINQVIFFTKTKKIELNRVFSPPANDDLNLMVTEKNKKINYLIKKDDCFENYFLNLKKNLYEKNYFYYLMQIKKDHLFRNKIENKFLNKYDKPL
jgi:NDP-hexose-3-ketoreductase